MKEIIALLLFIICSSLTIYLAVRGRIPLRLTIALLVFSIFTGIAVSNYDIIYKIKWAGFEIETAKNEIKGFKESALKEIAEEVKDQKEAIRLLISNATDTSEKIEKQKEALSDLIRKASDLQTKIEDQKKKLIGLNDSADKTKKDIEALNYASEQVALILVRVTYFTLETKGDFGTARAKNAMQEVEKDLRKLLPIIIPNEEERSAWVRNLNKTLSQ
jgi:methyl-accepting chemotaxis protein